MIEPELLKLVVAEVQTRFEELKDLCFFLKLERSNDSLSYLSAVETFPDRNTLMDYFYDSKMRRACILVRRHEDHYKLFCDSFSIFDAFDIWPAEIRGSRPSERGGGIESQKQYERELIENGFGEIAEKARISKRLKAV